MVWTFQIFSQFDFSIRRVKLENLFLKKKKEKSS